MKQVYAPGCALMIYKPKLAKRILALLNIELGDIKEHPICCRHEPKLESCTRVINTCASCIKAMYIGGKKPRYIIDLLFGETTGIGTFEPDAWHAELEEFIEAH